MYIGLGLLGGLIVVALAVVALRLWRQVWQREEEIKEYQKQVLVNEQKRTDHIHESLNVIANALLDDQVRVAEASIRMAVLMSNLPLSCDSKHRFAPVFEVYNLTQHIPTHSKWKSLDRAQQRKFEKELQSIEKEYADRIHDIAKYIKANPFGEDYEYEAVH